jgi:predicted amidohydrolase
MTRKVKILGLQINAAVDDKVKNYQKVSALLKENEGLCPDLVVLPETFNSGYDYHVFQKSAEIIPADTTSMFLSGYAEKYHTNMTGSFIEKCPDGLYRNSLPVFDRTGLLVEKYQKIHLFYSRKQRKRISLIRKPHCCC